MRFDRQLGMLALLGTGLAFLTEGGTASVATRRPVAPPYSAVDIGIASFGVVRFAADDEPAFAAIHVRVLIAPPSHDVPWTIDTTTARLARAGELPVAALAVNADVPTLPIAIIEPGERRAVDFYFPAGPLGETALSATVFSYQLANPSRRFESRTRFGKVRLFGATEIAAPAGRGRSWWFDQKFPWITFSHGPGLAVTRAPKYATVTVLRAGYYPDAPLPRDRDD